MSAAVLTNTPLEPIDKMEKTLYKENPDFNNSWQIPWVLFMNELVFGYEESLGAKLEKPLVDFLTAQPDTADLILVNAILALGNWQRLLKKVDSRIPGPVPSTYFD